MQDVSMQKNLSHADSQVLYTDNIVNNMEIMR